MYNENISPFIKRERILFLIAPSFDLQSFERGFHKRFDEKSRLCDCFLIFDLFYKLKFFCLFTFEISNWKRTKVFENKIRNMSDAK